MNALFWVVVGLTFVTIVLFIFQIFTSSSFGNDNMGALNFAIGHVGGPPKFAVSRKFHFGWKPCKLPVDFVGYLKRQCDRDMILDNTRDPNYLTTNQNLMPLPPTVDRSAIVPQQGMQIASNWRQDQLEDRAFSGYSDEDLVLVFGNVECPEQFFFITSKMLEGINLDKVIKHIKTYKRFGQYVVDQGRRYDYQTIVENLYSAAQSAKGENSFYVYFNFYGPILFGRYVFVPTIDNPIIIDDLEKP